MAHYHYGWTRQPRDRRDWTYTPRVRGAALPDFADVSAGLPAWIDQSALNACGPTSTSEMVQYDQKAEGLAVVPPSRLFIYYATRTLMGTVGQDSGVDNRTLLKALATYGYCAEALWPYDVTKFRDRPPPACVAAARVNRITNYAAVAQDLGHMKGTLAGGFPFLFGFDVYPQMEGDAAAETGIVEAPRAGASPVGGHDVTFGGYSDRERPGRTPGRVWPAGHFRFLNHWRRPDGRPWGDDGYGYLPYDYATGPRAGDCWVVNAVPGQKPSPPAPPVPGPAAAGLPAWVLPAAAWLVERYGPLAPALLARWLARAGLPADLVAAAVALAEALLGDSPAPPPAPIPAPAPTH